MSIPDQNCSRMLINITRTLKAGIWIKTKKDSIVKMLFSVSANFRTMSFQEHFKYWVFPLSASVIFLFSYFTGTPLLQEIIAPKINREFGLIENIQNVLILIVAGMNIFMMFRTRGIARSFHLGAAVVFGFLFAEEIDYGLHWIEYLNGVSAEEQAQVRNIHNQGGMLNIMRFVGNLLVVAFAVLPYFYKGKNTLLGRMLPSEKTIFTVISFIIVTRLAYLFVSNDFTGNGSLHMNRAEFEEVVIYYVFFLYFNHLRQRQNEQGNVIPAGQ